MYKNKKVFILGMARSGYEVAKLLASDNNIFITDMKEQDKDKIDELNNLGVKFKISNTPEELLDDSYDLVIKNPGIKYNHKCVLKARTLSIPVINELEAAYHYLDKSVNIIGITGSNGKTTTTTIIYEIFKKYFGDRVHLGGNIGIPLSNFVRDIKPNDYLIMEISDHQLCDMYDFKTNVSVMTNISDCHSDFHDGHERYVKTKKKIFNNHSNLDYAIINYNNEEVMDITNDINSIKLYFSNNSVKDCYYKNGYIYYKGAKYLDTSKVILKGMHNYENIMCAIMASKIYNIPDDVIREVISNFKGVEHRLEYVGEINGRIVYNDSKSTNVESTVIALNSFNSPTILLMGGFERGHSFDDLRESLSNTKLVVTFGETKDRIKEFMDSLDIKCKVCEDLVSSTKYAYDNSIEGDIILLSPACASWDQFSCFEDRGTLFKSTINSYNNKNTNTFFLDKNINIYMMGIGGVSMSGIADILANMGYRVSGSDREESKMTKMLEKSKIKVLVPQSKDNITDDIDFIVYTAAIKEDNPEMIEAKRKNIKMMERGEFLGELTKLFSNTIGVSGTHGKTTTTSMLSCIFIEAGMDPTIQVGSILSNINGNYRIGKSDNFLIEACEYCDSFLSFHQKSAIVLNIDNDHLDYFKNLDNIKKSFNTYVSHLPEDGFLIINEDDENSKELSTNTKAQVITYGLESNSNFKARNISYNNLGFGSFDVIYNNENLGRIDLSVVGKHNISNALSAIALSYCYSIPFDSIKLGLLNYHGASRRFEYKGKFNGANVFDDYGHHPTEVNAIVNSISNMNYNKSWVVFEPHTYSRLYEHIDNFAKILSSFDNIIITDIYAARENNIYNIKEKDLVDKIKKFNSSVFHISDFNDIKSYLSLYVKKDDLIITLGAGYVTKLSDLLVKNN